MSTEDRASPDQDVVQQAPEADHWRTASDDAAERLRLAMDVGRLGIWEWNIPENRITREGYHEQLFGLAPGTFSGSYDEFLACLHPQDRDRVQAEIHRCLASREDYRQEYRVVWPDGTVRWIEGRARLECDEAGAPVRMLGVVQDITHSKQIEDQQQRFRALFEPRRMRCSSLTTIADMWRQTQPPATCWDCIRQN
jgi:PAS domain S-box-containing protein